MSELDEDAEDYVDACFMGDVDEAESLLTTAIKRLPAPTSTLSGGDAVESQG